LCTAIDTTEINDRGRYCKRRRRGREEKRRVMGPKKKEKPFFLFSKQKTRKKDTSDKIT